MKMLTMSLWSALIAAIPLSLRSWSGQSPLEAGKDSYAPFTDSIDAFIEDTLADWHTPGIAIAVVTENDTWAKGYGYASLEEGVRVTPHTLFHTASTTKSFLASTVALLVQDNLTYGHISWQTPLAELAAGDLVLKDPWTTFHLTFEDALSHRSGYPRHDLLWINREVSAKDATRSLRHLEPSAPFRTKWQYNNLMYVAVSHVVELLTGRNLERTFSDWLWKPLGMYETYLGRTSAEECKRVHRECVLASHYQWDEKTSMHVKISESSLPEVGGAGGIISNVHDYAKWVRNLMLEAGPVSRHNHRAMRSPLSIVEPVSKGPFTGPQTYGMGMGTAIYRNQLVVSHDGGLAGFWSKFAFLPERGWGVVTMENAAHFGQESITWRLIDEFLGTPEHERWDWNTNYHNETRKDKEATKAQPAVLYPNIPDERLSPALSIEHYAGQYEHPAYGNITLEILSKKDRNVVHPLWPNQRSEIMLVGRTKFYDTEYTLHHVFGEYWLVEEQLGVVYQDVPDHYSKAKFDVDPDGKVGHMELMVDMLSVQGDSGVVFQKKE